MFKSAILQMYNGHRGTCDAVKLSAEYSRRLKLAIDAEKRFEETLAAQYPELLAGFDNMITANDDARSLECDDYYAEGFRFGALMAMDILGFINIDN